MCLLCTSDVIFVKEACLPSMSQGLSWKEGFFLVNVSVNKQSYIFNSTVTVAPRDLLKVIKKNVQCLGSLQQAKQFAQGQNTQLREQATQC